MGPYKIHWKNLVIGSQSQGGTRDRGAAEPTDVGPGQTAPDSSGQLGIEWTLTWGSMNPGPRLGSTAHGESRPCSEPHSSPGKRRGWTDSSPHPTASQWSAIIGLIVSLNIMSVHMFSFKSHGRALFSYNLLLKKFRWRIWKGLALNTSAWSWAWWLHSKASQQISRA